MVRKLTDSQIDKLLKEFEAKQRVETERRRIIELQRELTNLFTTKKKK